MFDLVRNHKRWMLVLVLILILPSFVLFGLEGYARFMESDRALVRIGDASITEQQFQNARRNQLDQERMQLGARFDPMQRDTPAMRQQTLDRMIDAYVIAAAAADGRFAVSDTALRQAIASMPATQEDGRFSVERYRQVLAAQGMNEQQFEASMRYELAQAMVLEPVFASEVAPATVVSALLSRLQQERTVRMRSFPAEAYLDVVEVSEADVQAYYEANAQQFAMPETVDAQYVLLDSQAVMREPEVSDDELAAYYEQNRHRFSRPESRAVSHILVQPDGDDEAAIAAARERAEGLLVQVRENPEGFADLARAESDDPGSADVGGSLGPIERGTMVAPFEEAAFALSQDEISDLVQTDFGFHIIKADSVQPADVPPLADLRDELLDEIALQQASERFGNAAGQMTQLVYDSVDSLAPVADALELTVQQADGISRERAPEDAPDLFHDPRVRQALFSTDVLRNNANSGVIELAPDRLAAVRAVAVHPAHTAPLADVSDAIRDTLRRQRALAQAEAEGEAFLESARAGDPVNGWGEPVTTSRANPGEVAEPLLEMITQVPADATLPAFVGAAVDGAFEVAEVQAIAEAPEPDAEVVRMEGGALSNAYAEAQVDALVRDLRRRYEVVIEPLANRVVQQGGEEDQG